jgi:exonuclease III
MVSSINLISFNLHGFNQGVHVVGDLINDFNYPDIVLVQEHWLAPDNIARLNCFEGYFVFATSGMLNAVEKGPLYGRPFGVVSFIINESRRSYCKLVCSSARFIAVTLYDLLIINVYLPCDSMKSDTGFVTDFIADHKLFNCVMIFIVVAIL